MTLVTYKILAALLIFASSLIAVIYPLKLKRTTTHYGEPLELGEAFASGIFLGVAFFHMLPEARLTFQQFFGHSHYPVAELICVSGFIFLLFLERLSLASPFIQPQTAIPYILAIMLIIHSLIEGTALGINTTFSEALMLFIAIIAHKGSASFALCVTLMRYHFSFRHILFVMTFFSLMTPLGIGLGTGATFFLHSETGQIVAAVFNAFAAGTFFYMSTLHHVQFHKRAHEAQGMLEFFCLLVGLVLMGVIVAWV
ncbi:MAG: hypothetical protein A3J38_00645 [Gammaproteobacteria bacterium RIFCSPHIGHO2_12_FULL_45_9]|nr:MAG: hypothetical protein A3J38_00645 [Gammaproteobacteria bacterium RIFCSPHIGHO2_12_FULL_45_9]